MPIALRAETTAFGLLGQLAQLFVCSAAVSGSCGRVRHGGDGGAPALRRRPACAARREFRSRRRRCRCTLIFIAWPTALAAFSTSTKRPSTTASREARIRQPRAEMISTSNSSPTRTVSGSFFGTSPLLTMRGARDGSRCRRARRSCFRSPREASQLVLVPDTPSVRRRVGDETTWIGRCRSWRRGCDDVRAIWRNVSIVTVSGDITVPRPVHVGHVERSCCARSFPTRLRVNSSKPSGEND